MKTIIYLFKKRILILILMFITAYTNILYCQGDVNIKVSQSTINSVISALIESRSINFGDYLGTWYADGWFVNLDAATITIGANNAISMEASIVGTIENPLTFINNFTVHANVGISGNFQMQNSDNGFKLLFVPTTFVVHNITSGSWTNFDFLSNLISSNLTVLGSTMGPIELNVGTKLLPNMISSDFISTTPVLSTLVTSTENYVVLSFLVNGPRRIIIQNNVSGLNNVGTIKSLESTNWATYNSPFVSWWDVNSNHSFQIGTTKYDYANQAWRYKSWDDNDAAIQKNINVAKDQTYTANYNPAVPCSLLTSLLEGGTGGNFLFQGISSPAPDYDYCFMPPNTTTIGVTSPQTINGRNYYFLNWQDGNTNPTRTISSSTAVTYTANLKGSRVTNTSTAFSNSSQRKLVYSFSSSSVNLHLVYESLGRIWYETSSDGGSTWVLRNGGKPISSVTSKLPSIVMSGQSDVLICYQEQNGEGYNIKIKHYDDLYDIIRDSSTVASRAAGEYTDDTNPAIVADPTSNSSNFIVAWTGCDGNGNYPSLYYKYGKLTQGTSGYLEVSWLSSEQIVTGTDANSQTPTVDCLSTSSTNIKFHLAWEQRNSGYTQSAIDYCMLSDNGSGALTVGTVQNISSGDGYTINKKPSIIATQGPGARVEWNGVGSSSVAVFTDPSTSRFWNFGSNVNNVSINAASYNGVMSKYVVAWAKTDATSQYTDNTTLSTITSLSGISGSNIQISNGSQATGIRAMSLNTSSLPYSFSNQQIYSVNKTDALAISSGRGSSIFNDNAQYFYTLGDVSVDGQNVKFIDLADTVKISSLDQVNSYVKTEPFSITDNSKIDYSSLYNVINSGTTPISLQDNDRINFKVELVDENDGSVISTLDNVTYNKDNITANGEGTYEISAKGAGNRTVRLCLVTENNTALKCALTEKYATGSVLAKSKAQQLELKNTGLITNYDLAQNYPNPFNPSTTISYQLPKASKVVLKVYDVLGQEIMTLVNGDMGAGAHSVTFNASKLASGVYLYKLDAGTYSQSKKMILTK
jgi:hypothetical protein